jgi:hypothetical protein
MVAFVACAAAACTGSIAKDSGSGDVASNAGAGGARSTGGGTAGMRAVDPGRPGAAGSGFVGDDPKMVPAGDPDAAGLRPVRRLTAAEYNNTVRDLLNDTSRPADAFPLDERNAGGFFEPVPVGGVEARGLRDAAEALAASAVNKSFSQLAPCAAGAAERTCADAFVTSFGRRAFRRPVGADDKTALLKLYDAVRAAPLSFDHKTAIRTLLAAMLQDPKFIYHWEAADGPVASEGKVVRLDGYQVAARLSYFLWQSMPDDVLAAAADGDKLTTPDGVEAQARRMLADAKAKDAVGSFYRQIIEAEKLATIVKDTKAYPAYTPDLAVAMAGEVDAFTADAVLRDGKLATLMTSSKSFAAAPLAKLYGVSGVAGSAPQPVTLDASQRRGLLTQAAFLTVNAASAETSPIRRGKVILLRFLCGEVPPPPPDVNTNLGAAAPGQQTREKFEAHETNPVCAGCHKVMDPLGFALESYDGIGAWRTMDAGRPVNTKVTYGIGDQTLSLGGATDLTTALATNERARRCATVEWLRFALGREDSDADTASLADAHAAFAAKDYDLRELMVGIARSRTFRFRSPAQGEVLQ